MYVVRGNTGVSAPIPPVAAHPLRPDPGEGRETPRAPEAEGYRGGVPSVAVRRQTEGVRPVIRRNSRLKLLLVLKPASSIA